MSLDRSSVGYTFGNHDPLPSVSHCGNETLVNLVAGRQDRSAPRTLFGQPIGLTNLFMVELWERFAFYGMLTILAYYLYHPIASGGLGLPKSTATSIVGAYGGLVYLSTVMGGWVADRLLGIERMVLYGGIAVMVGHCALAVLPGLTGLLVGLLFIDLGSGALKTNATSLLGTLYVENDSRRDGGFTLFYLGINLGAFIGPLVTGFFQTQLGFRFGFGVSAAGMAVGLTLYVIFRPNLGDHGRTIANPLPRNAIWRTVGVMGAVIATIAVAFVGGLFELSDLAQLTTVVIVLAATSYFTVMLRSDKVRPIERDRVRAFVPLFIANAAFWALFQQTDTVLLVYSEDRVNRSIFGWETPPNWVASIEPVWVIALSPLFALLWTKLGRRAPSTPHKFAYGVIGMGGAFLLFLTVAHMPGRSVPVLLVAVFMGVFAVSELILSPTGLSVTTQLAPDAFRGQMTALYFFSIGLGTAMSGVLARYYNTENEFVYFGTIGIVAIAIGLIIWALAPRISRLMAGVH